MWLGARHNFLHAYPVNSQGVYVIPSFLPCARVSPGLCIKPFVCRRHRVCGNPKQAIKCGHRPEATVKAKDELVKIGLQVLRRDSVVSPKQPRCEVPESDMDHREVLVGLRVAPTDGHSVVAVAQRGQRFVPDPRICPYFRTWPYVRLHERHQRLLLTVRNDL